MKKQYYPLFFITGVSLTLFILFMMPRLKLKNKLVVSSKNTQVSINKAVLGAFEFEERYHDFGVIAAGSKVSHTFYFKNIGSAPLLIEDISTSCGCTAAEWTKVPVQPLGSGKIKIAFSKDHSSGVYVKTPIIKANIKGSYTSVRVKATVK